MLKSYLKRLRGDNVLQQEMAQLRHFLEERDAGTEAHTSTDGLLNANSLKNVIEPVLAMLMAEHLGKTETEGSEWWQRMTTESYLGTRHRSSCVALEDLHWGRKLNLGPGANWSRPGWTTMDLYHEADVEFDFREKPRFPFEDGSTSVVFTSHMLEHMDNESGINVMNESCRVLKPGGLMRVAVPDLGKALLAYEVRDVGWFLDTGMNLVGDSVERLLVNWVTSYVLRDPRDGPVSYSGGPPVEPEQVGEALARCENDEEFIQWCVSLIPSDAPYVAHVNGFTLDKLKGWFEAAGFRHVVVSGYRQSIMPELRQEGFDNHASASLFMEALK